MLFRLLHTQGRPDFGPSAWVAADEGNSAAGRVGGQLRLDLGLTDYRSFLGTNAAPAPAQHRLQRDGAADCDGDAHAYLSPTPGLGGVTGPSDGFLVLIVRSAPVAAAQPPPTNRRRLLEGALSAHPRAAHSPPRGVLSP